MLDLYEFVSKFRYLFQNMEKLMEIRIPKNSFSVVPAFAHCTSRSTHRTVNAQSTRREYNATRSYMLYVLHSTRLDSVTPPITPPATLRES